MRPTLLVDTRELEPWLLRAPPRPERVDWREVFGREAPVELEVGCGKGQWLVDAARAAPERNFAGVEVRERLALYVAQRLARHEFPNARVRHDDAALFLAESVPPASLAAVHLYFPDPWWKPRHRHRRVYTPRFFVAVERALGAGGILSFATDVERVDTDVVAAVGAASTLALRDERAAVPFAEGTPTNFQRKAREGGRSVRCVVWVKR